MDDSEVVAITKWLNDLGFDFDMRDGLWMEDTVSDHKWIDVFELMSDYADYKLKTMGPPLNLKQASLSKTITEHVYEIAKDVKSFSSEKNEMIARLHIKLTEMKEALGIAFMAETGLKASEVELVMQSSLTETKWFYRRIQ